MKSLHTNLFCLLAGAVIGFTATTKQPQPALPGLPAQTTQTKVSKQAKLDKSRIEKTLRDLKPGDSCYTVPWAMWVDKQRRCWLNPNYVAQEQDKRGGTSTMLVSRDQDGNYSVDINACENERWDSVESPSYTGQNGPWIPVTNIITSDGL